MKATKKQKQAMRQVCDKIADARQSLEELLGDWTDRQSRRSDKWQESEAGMELQSAISDLELIVENLEEAEQFADAIAESEE